MISNNLYVIAAICGNFWQESQINPGAWENWTVGQPGYGLGQWTDNPPVVMRRTALFNWLDANSYSRDSGPGQLAFLVHENLWIPTSFQQSAYNTLSAYFGSTSTNLSDLVLEWMYHWEGINDGSYNTRLTAATQILADFQNDDGTRQPWTAVNSQISFRAARDNAMHIKDFFLEEDPPTPPGPEDELIALLKLACKKKLKGGIFIAW